MRAVMVAAGAVLPLLAAAPALAQADDGLDLSGNVRLRYEAITNQPSAGYKKSL